MTSPYQSTDKGVATIVIRHRVKEGAEASYHAWQSRIAEAAQAFDGYLGREFIKPDHTHQEDWVVIWRFKSNEKLQAWLNSDVRNRLFAEGESFIQTPFRIRARQSPESDEVTVTILHRVKPHMEEKFLKAVKERQQIELKKAGCTGCDIKKTIIGDHHEWLVLFKFENEKYCKQWAESKERAKFLNTIGPCVHKSKISTIGRSPENWFSLKASNGLVWKRPMAILLGLYPIIVLSMYIILPFLKRSIPAPYFVIWLSTAINIAILTWIAMPFITYCLNFWLRPDTSKKQTITGVCLVLLAYAALIFGFSAIG